MERATLEDLAFSKRSSRESDGVGPEDCLRKLRPVDSENTPLLPQRNQFPYSAEAYGWKKPFEGGAGTVPLRRRGERSLKPSIFFLAGEKDACF
jgi:hypothetical protein